MQEIIETVMSISAVSLALFLWFSLLKIFGSKKIRKAIKF